MSGPLSGLRVVDVSIMAAGPWAAVLLGQLGAEVIKIEPPSGDGTRWVEPLQHGMGTNFMCMNVNKQDITLDLKKPGDLEQAIRLCETADIFVQNYRGGVIERLGLGYAALKERNPQLIYCSISGFGESGPLAKEACADFIMQAYSGFARLNGRFGDALEAFRFSGFVDLTTSIVATEAVLAALLQRYKTGLGQKVEISMLQAALEMQFTRMAEILGTGRPFAALGSQSPGLVPDRAFPAVDGEVFVTVHDQAQWRGFCTAVDRPELCDDPRFATNAARVAHRKELDALLEPVLAARPKIWWMRVFERHGVACALAQNFEQLRYHAQVRENGMIADVQTPQWGQVVTGGLPWHFSATPGSVVPPPVPGGDTERILAALRKGELPRPKVEATGVSLTAGLRVVELASGVSGPLAACRLGDLGADVVKVELDDGDWMRHCPPMLADGQGAAWFALNRNKRSVQLKTGDAETPRALQALLADADVLITDMPKARLDGLGLGGVLDARYAANPRLIVMHISALGLHGPLAHRPGSELCAQAMAGYTRYLGVHDEPAVRLGADVGGCATAIFVVQAVLAALYARARQGGGQRVDLSLLNSLLSMKTVHLAAQSDPDVFEGPRVGGAYDPPEHGWRTADEPITFAFGGAVGAEGRPGWTQFVARTGLSHLLDDPRFDKNGRRTTGLGPKAREFKPEYEAQFIHRSSEELVARVREFGGLASAYLSHEKLLEEPQMEALHIVQQIKTAHESVRVLRFPADFSSFSPRCEGTAPALGEHTQSVLATSTTRN